MAKNNKISRRRDHNMKTVELHLDRKYSRQTDLRTHPLDEPFYSNRGEGIDTAPQVGVVTIPLTNEGTIYQAGLYHQDGNHSNLGGFRAGVGKDGGNVYRVNADKQGLHKSFATTLFLNDEGTFSVWVKGFNGGAAFDLNYEYVLCVHQVNEQATPEDVDSLVIRWELAQEELRLYPDITNNANVYVAIPLTEAQWQDENWHKISASWSYQNNNWTLRWDDGSGILNAPGFPAQVNHPDWDFSTIVEIFTNRVFEEHIGHDVQFLSIGSRSPGVVNYLEKVHIDTSEPTGIIDITESTISWSNSGPDRTFTIAPASTSFSYYVAGTKYTKLVSDTLQVADTNGPWWFYYVNDILTAVNSPTLSQIKTMIEEYVLIAVVYWNSTLSEGKLFEERHGSKMDGATHYLFHQTVGLAYDYGFALGNILTDESGDLDSHAQFSNTSGRVHDEDLITDIDAVGSTTGLLIWYMDAAGTWTWDTNPGFSVIDDGVGARLAYNETGVGLTEVANNSFVLCHVFASNIDSNELIAIVGQEEYGNISAAQLGAETEILTLLLGDLPTEEMLPIATVIFQTGNGYGNTVKARIRSTSEGDDYIDWRQKPIIAGGGTSDSDKKVAVDVAATPDYLGATSGVGALRTGSGLTKTDGGDFITLDKGLATYIAAYPLANHSQDEFVLANRVWRDETMLPVSYINQVDYPRRIIVTCTNGDFVTNQTGTVTINGLDADGAVIADVITVDVPPGAPVVYTSTHAHALITSIVVDQTDTHPGDLYKVGTDNTFGVPNYPITSVFKAAVEGADNGVTLVSATYGLVQLNPVTAAPKDIVFFYRSSN